MDYVALRNEIQADPMAFGYAASVTAGNDQAVADALNLVRAGAGFQVAREPITTALFLSKADPNEYLALTQLKLLQLTPLMAAGTIDINDASTQAILLGIFPNPGNTRTNVAAILNRTGSRAEQLFGRGTTVTANDVSRALRGQ